MSREQRQQTEEDLKAGRLPAVVATSSLELGIDMGAVDLVVDPSDPNTLYAAMWQFRRKGWSFSSGGPGSGLYKTTDGGKTWKAVLAISENTGVTTYDATPPEPSGAAGASLRWRGR